MTKDDVTRKVTDAVEESNTDSNAVSKKKTNQLHQLPPHKIRTKKVSKSSAPICTGGGLVVAHEKEASVQQTTTDLLSHEKSRNPPAYSDCPDTILPDKIDLPKLALDQLSNCSSNNSPRNFILSPRSQKSLFTATQSPLTEGKML